MPEPKAAAGSIADRVEVKHAATHIDTPSFGDVLLSGVRVGHVFYSEGLPVSFLPRTHHGIRLSSAELTAIKTAAQEKAKSFAESDSREKTALKEMGV